MSNKSQLPIVMVILGFFRIVIRFIKKNIGAISILVGIILTESGILNALSTTTIHTVSNEVIVTYPKLLGGISISILGVVLLIIGYTVIHGRFRLLRNAKLQPIT